ncbi:MAG: hypothetical protein GYA12_09360 [Chloroflexi bacterium]|jgi:hypothetical protein|nr:hypothetical protein [Chloroflexota bacterium]BCY17563.1 hypothetical protein hrd7_14120 [Leptolinea sp. HRD-7]
MGQMVDTSKHLSEFRFKASKNGKVFIFWTNRMVKTLSGEQARNFLTKVNPSDEHSVQLLLAKATGNFKRGNERKSPKTYKKEDYNARSVSG